MHLLNKKPNNLLIGASLLYTGFIVILLYVLLFWKTTSYFPINIKLDNLHLHNELLTGDLYNPDSLCFVEKEGVMKVVLNNEERFINFEILDRTPQSLKIKIKNPHLKLKNDLSAIEGIIFVKKESEKVILSDLLSY